MKLARVVVSNFRNLLSVDVRVDGGAVIVGENRSGKSNLLHAVRLVLDPTLTSAQRTLTVEDFPDTLGARSDGRRIDPAPHHRALEVPIRAH